MKKLLLTLGLTLSLSSAHAIDNQVDINLEATVARACFVDLAPGDQASLLETTISGIALQLPAREEEGQDIKTVTIYETCNDAYKLNIKSLNGGLKHATSDYVHAYMVRYPDQFSGAGPMKFASELPNSYSRDLTIWEGADPENRAGKTPSFEPQTLEFRFPQSTKLPVGDYADTVTVEMASVE